MKKEQDDKREASREEPVSEQREEPGETPGKEQPGTGEPSMEPVSKPPSTKQAPDSNIVFVGRKPTMSYVMAVVTQFSAGASQVDLKARGKSISRAVDVAEVVRNRFFRDCSYRIEIGTDSIDDEQGNKINVSKIRILLSK